ncbi:MAG: hypothetical protein QN172_06840 [Armatimonadota bacterium]|nr:hypothetical protein [Armatimonadota bacterium]MDR7438433.1 hypothetical protein [Armatimonadota bacterium]MDR7563530.1 hypothetical protein [Armatimonadota bacterium]MDR7567302.1 hypothetical protein [Armatimonadota bacterium]MDR7602159.1 hypothetical protein [Armatimonadota bacterium]
MNRTGEDTDRSGREVGDPIPYASSLILDASASLVLLQGKPGTERWETAVGDAAISAVNLSEVVAKLADLGMSEQEIRSTLEPLALEVADFDAEQAWETVPVGDEVRVIR